MLLHDSDLPDEWVVTTTSPDESAAIEAALAVDAGPAEEVPAPAQWVRIANTVTHESAWLRTHSERERGVIISGVVFLPSYPGDRVNNRSLRALPLAGIESAATSRRLRQLMLAAYGHHSEDPDWTPLDPLGSPRDSPHFYERVARQFMTLKEAGEARPVARMVEISQRPAKTVQGWVTEARRRGLLPAGRRGKAG